MKTTEEERIRTAVRARYGQIARTGGGLPEARSPSACCGPVDTDGPPDAGSCCGPSECTQERLSALTGYTQQDLQSVPEGANMGLGCGNPLALASLVPGETVVDLGSGGGFDCFLAAEKVGAGGQVIGVDMTPDMVAKARMNADKAAAGNVSFRLGEIEHLPIADNHADIIISNCVVNLSPDKRAVYREAYRVLKPGGRIAISDILATAPLPDDIRDNLALVSACIGGAATIEETHGMLTEAGFEKIHIEQSQQSRQLIEAYAPDQSSRYAEYIVSASMEAYKPNL